MKNDTAVTCPSWCKKDHAKHDAETRAQYAQDIEAGHIVDSVKGRETLEHDVAGTYTEHSRVFDASAHLVEVVTVGSGSAELHVLADRDWAGITSVDARSLASALQGAADLLDEIL
ncbi:hypothetical protein ASD11_07340 [Aeromicrobium sp. Root495]|uniref:hypothetical protein n=1 Tax=Aeromicrobium sp. Root495 TaxID=1736550 RepID=UPI0006F4A550|nr:hypothetical protein [Aeromicrobium sp. Root495]KQY59375.1 hypothetical protein ASD11_07340 [Aeromicrobium sp. Root495]